MTVKGSKFLFSTLSHLFSHFVDAYKSDVIVLQHLLLSKQVHSFYSIQKIAWIHMSYIFLACTDAKTYFNIQAF